MNYVMIGNSEYSSLLAEYLEDENIHIEAFVVDGSYISDKEINGKPVMPLEEVTRYFNRTETKMFLGVGYSRLGSIRKKLYMQCKEKGYDFMNYIHPSAAVDKTVKLGEGNVLFENVVIQKHTVINDCNLFFSNSVIMHDDKIGSFNTFCAGSILNGWVSVGDCNFMGANATLRDHISILSHVLVGAGAYVNRDGEENSYILPARQFVARGGYRTVRKVIKNAERIKPDLGKRGWLNA